MISTFECAMLMSTPATVVTHYGRSRVLVSMASIALNGVQRVEVDEDADCHKGEYHQEHHHLKNGW